MLRVKHLEINILIAFSDKYVGVHILGKVKS